MEDFLLFADEYGFFLKMTFVACVVVVAGVFIRRRGPQSHSEAD